MELTQTQIEEVTPAEFFEYVEKGFKEKDALIAEQEKTIKELSDDIGAKMAEILINNFEILEEEEEPEFDENGIQVNIVRTDKESL